MRYLITIIALIIYAFAHPQIAESKSSEFVLTFNCGNEKNFKLCLIGKFPPSKSITLLSFNNSDTCKTKAIKTFDYKEYPYDYGESLKVTPVDTMKCRQPEQYTLAYLEKDVFEFQHISMVQESSKAMIDKIDKIIRNSISLTESERYFGRYLSKIPVLYIPVPDYKDTYIVQYILYPYHRPNTKYGPLFFYANNKVVEIDGEGEITKTFKLNGRYFVMFDHGCWGGCGDINTTLLEIQDDHFKTIFKDGTWAD